MHSSGETFTIAARLCLGQAQSTEEDLTQATPSSLAKFLIFIIVVMILIVAGAVCRYRGELIALTLGTIWKTWVGLRVV